MTKAIIIKTGEVVTLRNFQPDKTIFTFAILEDNRVLKVTDIYILRDKWEFLTTFMNDYYHDQRVADSDDIECCLKGEADAEKLQRVKDSFGNTPERWEVAQIEIERELLEEAAYNFTNRFEDFCEVSE